MAKRTLPASEPGSMIPPAGFEAITLFGDGVALVDFADFKMGTAKSGKDQYVGWACMIGKGDLKGKAKVISFNVDPLWPVKNALRTAGAINEIAENESFELDDEEILEKLNGIKKVYASFKASTYGEKTTSQLAFLMSKEDAADQPKAGILEEEESVDFDNDELE